VAFVLTAFTLVKLFFTWLVPQRISSSLVAAPVLGRSFLYCKALSLLLFQLVVGRTLACVAPLAT